MLPDDFSGGETVATKPTQRIKISDIQKLMILSIAKYLRLSLVIIAGAVETKKGRIKLMTLPWPKKMLSCKGKFKNRFTYPR